MGAEIKVSKGAGKKPASKPTEFEPPQLSEPDSVDGTQTLEGAPIEPATQEASAASGDEPAEIVGTGALVEIEIKRDFPFAWNNVIIQFRQHHNQFVEPDMLDALKKCDAPIAEVTK